MSNLRNGRLATARPAHDKPGTSGEYTDWRTIQMRGGLAERPYRNQGLNGRILTFINFLI